jgi:hypothetical protein
MPYQSFNHDDREDDNSLVEHISETKNSNSNHNFSERFKTKKKQNRSKHYSDDNTAILGVNLACNTQLNSHFSSSKKFPESPQKVHLDYLQGYIERVDLKLLLDVFSNTYFQSKIVILDTKPKWMGCKEFKDKNDSSSIAEIYQDKFNYKYYLRIPGELISSLSVLKQHQLCNELFDRFKFVCTRVDIAIDDYERSLSYKKMLQACEKKNYSGFQTYSNQGDLTLYLGSTKSHKRVRFYDALHRHQVEANRLELQLRSNDAQQVYIAIATTNFSSEKEISVFLAKLMFDKFGFYKRTNTHGHKEKNIARCPKLPWWRKFTDKFEE